MSKRGPRRLILDRPRSKYMVPLECGHFAAVGRSEDIGIHKYCSACLVGFPRDFEPDPREIEKAKKRREELKMTKLSKSTREFWNERVTEKLNNDQDQYGFKVVRIEGHHYTIGLETAPRWPRGFGGRKFRIEFTDGPHKGQVIDTTNLWYQGEIPAQYRDLLPDNAKFVPLEEELV